MSDNSPPQSIEEFLASQRAEDLARREWEDRQTAFDEKQRKLAASRAEYAWTDYCNKVAGPFNLPPNVFYWIWAGKILGLAKALRDGGWLRTFEALTTTTNAELRLTTRRAVDVLRWALNQKKSGKKKAEELVEALEILHKQDTGFLTLAGEFTVAKQAMILAEQQVAFCNAEPINEHEKGAPQTNTPESAAPVAEATLPPPVAGDDANGKAARPKGRRTINMRMLDTAQKRPEATGWSARKWKEHLDCGSTSTVADTAAWKEWEAVRFAAKQARRKDRKRRANKVNQHDGE